METKDFRADIKALEGDGIGFEGLVSVFGNVDSGGDVVEPGAFTRTLERWRAKGKPIPVLANHDMRRPIGGIHPDKAKETERGLFIQAFLEPEVQAARETHALMKRGVMNDLSFGYDAIKADVIIGNRHLREVRLFEGSPVLWGMNEEAGVTAVKGAVPFQDLPLADRATAWDGAAAVKRVRTWAGGDSITWSRYRRAFLWYDSENSETFGAYKMPIADVIGGDLKAVPRAIFAAAAVLMGARGGAAIPEADKKLCMRHLSRYYAKLEMTAPWDKSDGFGGLLFACEPDEREEMAKVITELAGAGAVDDVIDTLQALRKAASGTQAGDNAPGGPGAGGQDADTHVPSAVLDGYRDAVRGLAQFASERGK